VLEAPAEPNFTPDASWSKAMPDHKARHRAVARAVTIALWAVGSAYLINSEILSNNPDYVVIASVPIVWAAIISLPILATYARHERQWLAACLIWIAATVGSVYTMTGTLSRNAEARDVIVARFAETAKERRRIEKDLADAKDMLAAARKKCGEGRECLPATKATIGVYEGAVAGHEHRLSKLDLTSPVAGERRIASLLTFATGKDLQTTSEIVGLVVPALFGLTLELAAFAVAMLGWHPTKPLPGKRAPLPANVVRFPEKHPVIAALERAKRPINNSELAKLMAVCDGEATKRRKEVADLISVARVGRECMISLKSTA
jgi:hypothetical protein